jgi:hypothetical protein
MSSTTASALKDAVEAVTVPRIEAAVQGLRQVSQKAAGWLTDRVEAGVPAYSDERNSWWRVPWALTLAGERSVAAGVLAWAESEALTGEGDLKPGPYGGSDERTPVYQLTHLALAAHLLDRFDLSARIYQRVLTYWNHDEGGAYTYHDRRDGQVDWLLTAQVGLVAVAIGDTAVRDQAYAWYRQMRDWQPALDDLVLVTGRDANGLRTAPATGVFNLDRVDFTKPKELYFQPGAAAAFLAEYSAQSGDRDAIALARGLMTLNVEGTVEQITDPESVHACKFPWGAAELSMLDGEFDWIPYLVLFAEWFADRQEDSGAWLPSAFTLTKPATDADRMWKTAEHLMEVQKISAGLSARLATLR